MKKNSMFRATLALVLVISMVAGFAAVPVAAAETDTYSYVSLGASNTNGYGLRGYILEEEINGILSGAMTKDDVNVYGYKRCPAESYPALLGEYLQNKMPDKNVEVTQLAMSSMRAEELRVLLDNDYYGDTYTNWRFIKDDGTGWFNIAEPAGLDVLRQNVQDYVAGADLVTLDIGWNNFGVYVCNRLVSYMSSGNASYDADFSNIYDEDMVAVAEEVNALVRDLIVELMGEDSNALVDTIDFVAETFTYALLGYIHNFDIIVERIDELNPDTELVVLGIQNLLYGVDVYIEDLDATLPLGDIYGAIVNMANNYISKLSPNRSRYLYTMTGNEDGHVETFLDYIAEYDGDVENLSVNVKDCFDLYDDDLMIQYKLQYVFGEQYGEQLAAVGLTANEFFAMGAAGTLPAELAPYYEAYVRALNAAYDTLARIMQTVANTTTLDLAGLSGMSDGDVEDQLLSYIENSVFAAATAAANGEEYVLDTSIFEDPAIALVAVMNVRFYVGNSFFAHPSENGHVQIRDAIIEVMATKNGIEEMIKAKYEKLMAQIQDLICPEVPEETVPAETEPAETEPAENESTGSYINWMKELTGRYIKGIKGFFDFFR